jgi:hypothetical protein
MEGRAPEPGESGPVEAGSPGEGSEPQGTAYEAGSNSPPDVATGDSAGGRDTAEAEPGGLDPADQDQGSAASSDNDLQPSESADMADESGTEGPTPEPGEAEPSDAVADQAVIEDASGENSDDGQNPPEPAEPADHTSVSDESTGSIEDAIESGEGDEPAEGPIETAEPQTPDGPRNPPDDGGPVSDASGLSWAEQSGILRSAAEGKGNFGLESATAKDAEVLGRSWVGEGYRVVSDGRTLISQDGLRQFRPPSYKPSLGIYQANFEQRLADQTSRQWFSNGHLNITDLP